jgi:phage shock protein A
LRGLPPAPPGSDATAATDAQPGVGVPVSGAALVDSDQLDADLTDPDSGVPTLDAVRDRIEGRYGRALGATELAEGTPEVRQAAERQQEREEAAARKLAELRAEVDRDRSR